MTERLSALFCIGCGRIDLRNRVNFVTADEFDDVSAEYDQAHREMAELAAVARQFAWVTPRPGEEKQTWQSLRSRAETALLTSVFGLSSSSRRTSLQTVRRCAVVALGNRAQRPTACFDRGRAGRAALFMPMNPGPEEM
jgi:hypothetical protein